MPFCIWMIYLGHEHRNAITGQNPFLEYCETVHRSNSVLFGQLLNLIIVLFQYMVHFQNIYPLVGRKSEKYYFYWHRQRV